MPETVVAEKIFIIPDATFVVELVLFLVTFYVLARFVVPPLQRAMTERAQTISRQLEEAEAARERLAAAEREYREAVAATKADATRIRDEARAEGQAVIEALRRRAQEEVDGVRQRGAAQLETERAAVLGQLREEIGRLAVDLAGRVVGEPLDELVRDSGSVEHYLAGLQAGVRVTAGTAAVAPEQGA